MRAEHRLIFFANTRGPPPRSLPASFWRPTLSRRAAASRSGPSTLGLGRKPIEGAFLNQSRPGATVVAGNGLNTTRGGNWAELPHPPLRSRRHTRTAFLARARRKAAKARAAKPVSAIAQVEASGTLEPLIAMPAGRSSPEISAAFTVAPAVVYSPTVSPAKLVTNRSEPDCATPNVSSSPEISAAFTVAPEVVYSPIVPGGAAFVTNRSEPDTAMPTGWCSPEISAAFTVAPEVVYAPIVPLVLFATKIVSPARAAPGERDASRPPNRPDAMTLG